MSDHNARLVAEGEVREVHLRQLVKSYQRARGMVVTGICDIATQLALESAFRDADTGEIPVPNLRTRWPAFSGPLEALPKTRADCYRVFGNPGAGKLDARWERQNIVNKVTIPGLPNRIRIHRLVEPYVREAFRRALAAAPETKLQRVGGFEFRHERHDPSRPLSKHAFGCAVDINPDENRLIKFGPRLSPEAWSADWKTHWPNGLSRDFTEAFCSVGFAWGGDWDEDGTSTDHVDLDPMHFELVDRSG